MMTLTPLFYLEPESTAYLDRLLQCGARAAAADWHSFPSWHSAQLANPVANDVRGGIGAATLMCLAAESHARRTLDIREAEVVLLCPHQYYNALLEKSPPCDENTIPTGSTPISRVARLKRLVTSSAAWTAVPPLAATPNCMTD